MDYQPRIREIGQSLDQRGIGLVFLSDESESHLGEKVLKDSPKKG
jgi:hypothetical protein